MVVRNSAFVLTYVQTLVELLLLLIDYTEAEVDLVCLFEGRLHAHDLREGLFRMLQGSIAVVEYANAIPKFGLLDGC